MKDHVLVSVRLLVVFTILLGFGYPAAVWAVGRVAFRDAADGSFVSRDGKVVGSSLIGQAVTSPGLFRTRPSAAGSGYDAAASSGSNLGPTSKALADRVTAEAAKSRAENVGAKGPVPADAVTASGSGLDPHVSPEFALWQVPRVARETGISAGRPRGHGRAPDRRPFPRALRRAARERPHAEPRSEGEFQAHSATVRPR